MSDNIITGVQIFVWIIAILSFVIERYSTRTQAEKAEGRKEEEWKNLIKMLESIQADVININAKIDNHTERLIKLETKVELMEKKQNEKFNERH